MKDFFRTFWGKGLLYAAILISTFVLLLSVAGAAYMIYSDYYLRSEEDLRVEMMENMASNTSVEVFRMYYYDYDGTIEESPVPDRGNFIFRFLDKNGKTVLESSTKADSYPYRLYITVLPPHQSGTDFYEITSMSRSTKYYEELKANNYNTELYIVEGAVNPDLAFTDQFKLFPECHHFLYSLKFGIYFIGVASIIALAVSFIALMCVAGRRPKKEEIVPWYFHKVPFDILLGVILFLFLMSAMITEYSSREYLAALSFGWVVFLPLFFMSTAVRIKTHTLIKNTVTFKLLKLIWKGIKAVGRFIWTVITNMKLLWKVIIAFAVLMIAWFINIAAWDRSFVVTLFCLAPFTVFPLFVLLTLQINKLKKGAQELAEGHFDHVIDTKWMLPEIRKHAVNLNSIAAAQKIAVEEKLKSERMKTELITNVSHDIKTPLTSIINYADLISKEEGVSEKSKEYSEVLVRQSVRLKRLLEDLVEASKASTGNLEVDLQPCDAQVFVTQSAGEYEEKFNEYKLSLVTSVPDTSLRIMADGRRMQRVFDNLLNNACKYSLPGTRVFVDLTETDTDAVFVFKNTSKEPLNMSEEELLERFTRGDSSRNTEGSGLGLAIARDLTELQNGRLRLTTDGDLFKATLTFPKILS